MEDNSPENTAICQSVSPATHERLKLRRQISHYSHHLSLTDNQGEIRRSFASCSAIIVRGALLLMEQFRALLATWQRNASSLSEAECLPCKTSGVHRIHHKGLENRWGSPELTAFLWALLGSFLCTNRSLKCKTSWHQNRMQTQSQTGSCANEYANFSPGTNAVAVGKSHHIQNIIKQGCDLKPNGHCTQTFFFFSVAKLF